MKTKINISEFSDFCFGVKRAISLAEEALRKSPKPVFSLGSLIHNRQVVNRLSLKGLNIADIPSKIKRGTVVIRSHGIHPDALGGMKKKKIGIVDATCPFVKNAQRIAKELSRQNYRLIIIGDKGHPEVRSLRSFSGNKSFVVSTKDDAKRLKLKKGKIGIIAQTTQSLENFLDTLSELLKKQFSEVRIFNTICSDANMRQKATERFSKENDLVLVVGGRNSANTKRLYDICKSRGTEAYHVETGSEIKSKWLKGKRSVGLVSGASTPRWIVDEVVHRLKNANKKREKE